MGAKDLGLKFVLIYFLVAAVADAKSYIIISQLPTDVYGKFVEDRSSSHMSGLTFVVIGVVHLGGGRIAEGKLLPGSTCMDVSINSC